MDIENFFNVYGVQELIKQQRMEGKLEQFEDTKVEATHRGSLDSITHAKKAAKKLHDKLKVGKTGPAEGYFNDSALLSNDRSSSYFQDDTMQKEEESSPGQYEISLADGDETNEDTAILH